MHDKSRKELMGVRLALLSLFDNSGQGKRRAHAKAIRRWTQIYYIEKKEKDVSRKSAATSGFGETT